MPASVSRDPDASFGSAATPPPSRSWDDEDGSSLVSLPCGSVHTTSRLRNRAFHRNPVGFGSRRQSEPAAWVKQRRFAGGLPLTVGILGPGQGVLGSVPWHFRIRFCSRPVLSTIAPNSLLLCKPLILENITFRQLTQASLFTRYIPVRFSQIRLHYTSLSRNASVRALQYVPLGGVSRRPQKGENKTREKPGFPKIGEPCYGRAWR